MSLISKILFFILIIACPCWSVVRRLTRERGQYDILVIKHNSDLNLHLEEASGEKDSFVKFKIDIFIYF